MPRKPFVNSPINPYSIGGRAHNKTAFPLPLDEMWIIFCDQLHFVSKAFNLRVHNFVMMRNHFHLLASTPDANLSEAMRTFMHETSRTVHRITGDLDQFWGKRFFRTEITSFNYYENAYKYFYLNPVTAQICPRVEDYPYSTLRGVIGLDRVLLPVHDDFIVDRPDETLKWLNTIPEKEDIEAMKKALRRTKFKYPKLNNRKSRLETGRL